MMRASGTCYGKHRIIATNGSYIISAPRADASSAAIGGGIIKNAAVLREKRK